MHNDPAILAFEQLQPGKYNMLTRFDLRLYYLVERDTNATRADLWLGYKGKSSWAYEPSQLHLTCYEVYINSGDYFSLIPRTTPWYLSIESIRDRHLSRLHYAVKDREYGTLFQCHRFEANIEDVEFEYAFS
ncbi:MAG TPA: hypothetical protein VFV38_12705 [Ktedonobacteraceae bacterium]|nr:hypothetical protein [Ktedonobacteraceae bacterium]